MTAPNDGGPAFPENHYFDPGRGQYGMHMTASDVGCGGMSMRDWFAGQALQGYLAGRNVYPTRDPSGFEATKAAQQCYGYADAMLAARERKEDA